MGMWNSRWYEKNWQETFLAFLEIVILEFQSAQIRNIMALMHVIRLIDESKIGTVDAAVIQISNIGRPNALAP